MNNFELCPYCDSSNLLRQTGNDEPSVHYGRLTCGDCNRWLKWLRDPGNAVNESVRGTAIDSILENHSAKISDWDTNFLRSIRRLKSLSDKQADKLNAIALVCLGKRISL